MVQVVEGFVNNFSGGMEYFMVIFIMSFDVKVEMFDVVIVYEVGYNWFMSMLGSNECDYVWMDEGLNIYYQFCYEVEKYCINFIFGDELLKELKKLLVDKFQVLIYNVIG